MYPSSSSLNNFMSPFSGFVDSIDEWDSKIAYYKTKAQEAIEKHIPGAKK